MSDSDDIFDKTPSERERQKEAEARMFGLFMYIAVRQRMAQREASRPFDAKHRYGWLNMERGWSQCFPEDKQLWFSAAAEALSQFSRE